MRDKDMRLTQIRLEEAQKKIIDPAFRSRESLGNDIGYYIFDYPPEDELIVRDWVQYIQGRNRPELKGFELVVFDLYDIMIDILDEKGFLEKCYGIEEKDGMDRIVRAVGRTLKLSDNEGLIVEHIRENIPENTVILLTGVGKCYPILRAHKVLNNLHQMLVKAPVVMLYPGKYGEKSLLLFNNDEEDNYYWVKRLIEN